MSFPRAEAFLESAQLHNTWCVIADVRMPGMSGIELQVRLRSEGNPVPFVFVTAVPEESVRARALEYGAICFLTKPFDEDSLIACLGKALARHIGGELAKAQEDLVFVGGRGRPVSRAGLRSIAGRIIPTS